MDAQEILRRVKAIAQADLICQGAFSRGQAFELRHILDMIESLDGNRWEKKARILMLSLGPEGFAGVEPVSQALSEAYEEGYQLGIETQRKPG